MSGIKQINYYRDGNGLEKHMNEIILTKQE